ncbi:hypothetical protein G7K_4537-t1 [Saitoella complicata NRRL Y-17804]|uniref:GH16 domain-containing protein n=1 Tax=Saitoella complicata (strain BCRC 22490 / CBS 7301 / JCM 7358 / NBRC 10748 / NRRL Y-17804) TaxID=698492 RepID=A0A0E9NL64_SAICN|nr:hypothetical protein G7K_4537-t1 [Saitoella complicata NRRL Y-17804]
MSGLPQSEKDEITSETVHTQPPALPAPIYNGGNRSIPASLDSLTMDNFDTSGGRMPGSPGGISVASRFTDEGRSPIGTIPGSPQLRGRTRGVSGGPARSIMSSTGSAPMSMILHKESVPTHGKTEDDDEYVMFPKPFVSRRLHEPINKTGWEKETKNHWRLMQTLPWVGILIGLLASAFIGWWGWQSVPESTYQLILDENFSAGAIDPTIWNHEVQLNGFGTGNFDWTTTDSRNSYVKDGMLHIVPTLTSDVLGFDAITNGYTVNITGNGCTSESASDCAAVSNSTLGDVLPPVQSARLNTKGHYGINVYGEWPRSGEIDIAEARGNKPDFGLQGRDYVSSTIHWGPSGDLNKYYKTSNVIQQLHGDFSQDFHTYAIEWTPRYIFAYVDSRLRQGLSVKFNKKFWDRGNFDVIDKTNLTIIDNPWDVANATDSTPFDQDFYLILNVAVGGTNAYFADDMPGKPWADKSPTAKSDFWTARNSWYPTWLTEEERGMVVKSVKMYQWLGSERQYF